MGPEGLRFILDKEPGGGNSSRLGTDSTSLDPAQVPIGLRESDFEETSKRVITERVPATSVGLRRQRDVELELDPQVLGNLLHNQETALKLGAEIDALRQDQSPLRDEIIEIAMVNGLSLGIDTSVGQTLVYPTISREVTDPNRFQEALGDEFDTLAQNVVSVVVRVNPGQSPDLIIDALTQAIDNIGAFGVPTRTVEVSDKNWPEVGKRIREGQIPLDTVKSVVTKWNYRVMSKLASLARKNRESSEG